METEEKRLKSYIGLFLAPRRLNLLPVFLPHSLAPEGKIILAFERVKIPVRSFAAIRKLFKRIT